MAPHQTLPDPSPLISQPQNQHPNNTMQLKSLSIGRKAIKFVRVLNPDSDDDTVSTEEHAVTAKEAPLPELHEAFSKLPQVVCSIMGWPQDFAAEMIVTKLSMSYTKHETRSVAFVFNVPIYAVGGHRHTMDSPFVRIDKPADGESGDLEVTEEQAELIETAIREAERYAKGERSQQVIDFETASKGLNALADLGRDDDDGLEMFPAETKAPAKRRGKKDLLAQGQ
jgi:hypothetical protein